VIGSGDLALSDLAVPSGRTGASRRHAQRGLSDRRAGRSRGLSVVRRAKRCQPAPSLL